MGRKTHMEAVKRRRQRRRERVKARIRARISEAAKKKTSAR